MSATKLAASLLAYVLLASPGTLYAGAPFEASQISRTVQGVVMDAKAKESLGGISVFNHRPSAVTRKLFPIPEAALTKKPNLEQNPGY